MQVDGDRAWLELKILPRKGPCCISRIPTEINSRIGDWKVVSKR